MKENFPVTITIATPVILVSLAQLQPADDNLRGQVGDVAEARVFHLMREQVSSGSRFGRRLWFWRSSRSGGSSG